MAEEKLEDVIYFMMERNMRRARHITYQVFNKHGIDLTVDQWVTLKKISETENISQKEIAEAVFKDAPTVTRIIDLLCKKGLTERKTNPNDRRKFFIHLTEEGEKTIRSVFPLVKLLRLQSTKNFSKEELNELRNYLNRIFDNLNNEIDI